MASADIPGRMTAATRSFATVIVSVFGIPRLGVLQHPQRFATAKVAAALSVAALRLLAVSENNRYSLPDSPPGFSVALSSGVLYVLPSALAQTSAITVRGEDIGGASALAVVNVSVRDIALRLTINQSDISLIAQLTLAHTFATLTTDGDYPPYNYTLEDAPPFVQVSDGIISINGIAQSGSWTVRAIVANRAPVPRLATAIFSITAYALSPVRLQLSDALRFATAGFATIALVSASGGYVAVPGIYQWQITSERTPVGRPSFYAAEVTAQVLARGLTMIAIADDDHPATAPATVRLTVSVSAPLFLQYTQLAMTYTAGSSAPLVSLDIGGGLQPYTYTAYNLTSGEQVGVSSDVWFAFDVRAPGFENRHTTTLAGPTVQPGRFLPRNGSEVLAYSIVIGDAVGNLLTSTISLTLSAAFAPVSAAFIDASGGVDNSIVDYPVGTRFNAGLATIWGGYATVAELRSPVHSGFSDNYNIRRADGYSQRFVARTRGLEILAIARTEGLHTITLLADDSYLPTPAATLLRTIRGLPRFALSLMVSTEALVKRRTPDSVPIAALRLTGGIAPYRFSIVGIAARSDLSLDISAGLLFADRTVVAAEPTILTIAAFDLTTQIPEYLRQTITTLLTLRFEDPLPLSIIGVSDEVFVRRDEPGGAPIVDLAITGGIAPYQFSIVGEVSRNSLTINNNGELRADRTIAVADLGSSLVLTIAASDTSADIPSYTQQFATTSLTVRFDNPLPLSLLVSVRQQHFIIPLSEITSLCAVKNGKLLAAPPKVRKVATVPRLPALTDIKPSPSDTRANLLVNV